jgi:hypothetical protein
MVRSAWMRASVLFLLCTWGRVAADAPESLTNRLQNNVSLPKGIESNTPLRDALDHLADRWKLDIQVDVKLFRKKGSPDVEKQPVMLPRLLNVRLATILDLVARQVNGSCMLLKDRIIVVPRALAAGAKGVGYRPLPVVAFKADAGLRAKLDKQVSLDRGNEARLPLVQALRLLSDRYEVNIVIDEAAFRAAAAKDVANRSVELATIDNVRFAEVLEKLCSQAKGVYRLQENIIFIVPQKS